MSTFKQKLTIAILLAILIAAGISGYYLMNQKRSQAAKYTGSVEKIIFGLETSMLTSMVWVAENKGYFQEQGLDVQIKEFGSGRTALRTMLEQGGLDMVTVAQTPVMFNSFNRSDYGIIAGTATSNNDVKILARQDKGISRPEDLKGKKIGTTKGSTGHFFLGLFLTKNRLESSDVEIVDFEASELPQALADKKVDAISTWEPHIANARKLLSKKAILFEHPDILREDFYFVPKRDFIKSHPGALKRFLKAIDKADALIKNNKNEAIKIVSERLKANEETIALLWKFFNFGLFLDQAILITLEDEARWAIKEGLVDKKEVPSYLDYFYFDALEAVRPEAITMTHYR